MGLWLRSGMHCRREQKHSQWEFPDWIPVAHRWTCLSDRYRGSRTKGKVGQVPAGSGVSEGIGGTCAFTPLSLSVVGLGVSWIWLWSNTGRNRLCGGWDGAGAQGSAGGLWVKGGEVSHLSPHSEAAPYLPAEEQSPLFSIQREGIKEDGALYRLNRCVTGCPRAQQGSCQAVPSPSGCQAVPPPVWEQGLPRGLTLGLCCALGVPPAPAPALQRPSPFSHQQV